MDVAPAGARRVSVPASRLARWLDGFAERHGATRTDVGADVVALTGADGARAWVSVPFPPLRPATVAQGAESEGSTAALVEHALRRRRVGVLLVRRGGYAVGVFDGADLVASKVGSSYVQGTTKAGGWSQQRYARRRANQADAAFADAADSAARVLLIDRVPTGPGAIDALVAGGDREAVRAVLADRRLTALVPTGAWLQVKDPRRRVLEATPAQFLAVHVLLDP